MDLNENIKIAAQVEYPTTHEQYQFDAYIKGAKSQAAKEYWFEQFKQEEASRSVLKFIEHYGSSPLESIDMTHQKFLDEQMERTKALRKIGIIGHDMTIFGCGVHSDKAQFFQEMVQEVERRGVKAVIIGSNLTEEGLDRIVVSSNPEVEIPILLPPDRLDEEIMRLTEKSISVDMPSKRFYERDKPWDRKTMPKKMNNCKSKRKRK